MASAISASRFPTSVPYLPDLARRAGYRTAAFTGSLILDPQAGTAPGFDRGFDVYDAGFRLRRPGEDRYKTIERRGEEVASRAIRCAGTWHRGTSAPWHLRTVAPRHPAARSSYGCTCSTHTIHTIRPAP